MPYKDFSDAIFKQKYCIKDESEPADVWKRLSKYLAEDSILQKEYFDLLENFKFVPGGRILSNAHPENKSTLFNCYCTPIGDSIWEGEDKESIFRAILNVAMTFKAGGGQGVNLSYLRPAGSKIEGTNGTSCGPVGFLELFSSVTGAMSSGKNRRGALMAMMKVSHPDIEAFIEYKAEPIFKTLKKLNKRYDDKHIDKVVEYFQQNRKAQFCNISILISDEFMNAVAKDQDFDLRWEDSDDYYLRNKGKVYKTVRARELWNTILANSLESGEPGIVFEDTVRKYHNTEYYKPFLATNPCVVGDTLIMTNIGWIKIKNLLLYKIENFDLRIITRDETSRFYNSELQWCGKTKSNENLIKISFDNGEYQLVNAEHKFYSIGFIPIAITNLKQGDSIIGSNSLNKIIEIVGVEQTEDVYDLTAWPNYNFFALLNHEEIIVDEAIIINDIIKINYFSVVKTKVGQKFAFELEENDEIFEDTKITKIIKPNINNDYFSKSILNVDCSELPGSAHFACCLGSFNLMKFYVKDTNDFDYDSFKKNIHIAVQLLNNVLDIGSNKHPLEQQKTENERLRKIGIGVMGFADLCVLCGFKYDSSKAIKLLGSIMETLRNESYMASIELAKKHGSFPAFEKDKFLNNKFVKNLPDDIRANIERYGIRNSVLLSIAPTGTLSLIVGCSNGIEPIYTKKTAKRRTRKDRGVEFNENIIRLPILDMVSDKDGNLPDYVVDIEDINPMFRIKLLSVAQKYVDNAISTTINLNSKFTIEELSEMFITAHKLSLKGLTVYKEGSRMNIIEKIQ